MDINLLIEKAKKVALNSYSPYSKFRVGASLLTKNGEIFCGTNVENGSFGGTICAERVAITTAISNGYRDFEAICVVGLDCKNYIYPCGICLQFISEFGNNIDIIITN
ncbi:MAG TPA: cytidine deaminase, partial [Spirochaetota bacterium]|nr:cytidine deaminase [Spirochaetota bacterium]